VSNGIYTALKAEIALPAYSGMTVAQLAAALTANTAAAVDIPAASAFAVLAGSATGDWGRISNRASLALTGTVATDTPIIAAHTALAILGSGTPIKASQAGALATFQSLLSALVVAGDVSAASSTALLSLASATTNRATQLGFNTAACDMTQEIPAAQKWG
jgi:hypothetical protein